MEEIKKKRGRQTQLSNEKDYFKNYYHTSKLSDVTPCPICNCCIISQKLNRHQLSRKCLIIKNSKDLEI